MGALAGTGVALATWGMDRLVDFAPDVSWPVLAGGAWPMPPFPRF